MYTAKIISKETNWSSYPLRPVKAWGTHWLTATHVLSVDAQENTDENKSSSNSDNPIPSHQQQQRRQNNVETPPLPPSKKKTSITTTTPKNDKKCTSNNDNPNPTPTSHSLPPKPAALLAHKRQRPNKQAKKKKVTPSLLTYNHPCPYPTCPNPNRPNSTLTSPVLIF